MDNDSSVTGLLQEWSEGDREALDDLMTLVYTELKERCKRLLSGERPSHTLQPTALLNEVYLRLARLKCGTWENRSAFFAFAVRLMRQVLVQHARAIKAAKRGAGAQRVDLDLTQLPDTRDQVDVLALDDVLARLEERDPLMVRIIELRFFAGMSERELAEALGISRSRVQREWRVAKRWLARELEGGEDGSRSMD